MKTLDEVIKALRCTNPEADPETKCNDCPYKESHRNELWYVGPSCLDEMFADALHYLKEYRKFDSLDAVAFPEDDNPPLSWDDLKQMEGKPVWVEPVDEKGYWFVIEFFNNNPYYGGDLVCFTNDVMLKRSDLGKTWQAYRKERNEDAG